MKIIKGLLAFGLFISFSSTVVPFSFAQDKPIKSKPQFGIVGGNTGMLSGLRFELSDTHPEHEFLLRQIRTKNLPIRLREAILEDLARTMIIYSDEKITLEEVQKQIRMELVEIRKRTRKKGDKEVTETEKIYRSRKDAAKLGLHIKTLSDLNIDVSEKTQIAAFTTLHPRKVVYFQSALALLSKKGKIKLVLHEAIHRLKGYFGKLSGSERFVEAVAELLAGYFFNEATETEVFRALEKAGLNTANFKGKSHCGLAPCFPHETYDPKVDQHHATITVNIPKEAIRWQGETSGKYVLVLNTKLFQQYPPFRINSEWRVNLFELNRYNVNEAGKLIRDQLNLGGLTLSLKLSFKKKAKKDSQGRYYNHYKITSISNLTGQQAVSINFNIALSTSHSLFRLSSHYVENADSLARVWGHKPAFTNRLRLFAARYVAAVKKLRRQRPDLISALKSKGEASFYFDFKQRVDMMEVKIKTDPFRYTLSLNPKTLGKINERTILKRILSSIPREIYEDAELIKRQRDEQAKRRKRQRYEQAKLRKNLAQLKKITKAIDLGEINAKRFLRSRYLLELGRYIRDLDKEFSSRSRIRNLTPKLELKSTDSSDFSFKVWISGDSLEIHVWVPKQVLKTMPRLVLYVIKNFLLNPSDIGHFDEWFKKHYYYSMAKVQVLPPSKRFPTGALRSVFAVEYRRRNLMIAGEAQGNSYYYKHFNHILDALKAARKK